MGIVGTIALETGTFSIPVQIVSITDQASHIRFTTPFSDFEISLSASTLSICEERYRVSKGEHLSVPPECTTDKILNQAMKSRSRVRGMRLGNMELLNELAAYFEEKGFEHGNREVTDPIVTISKSEELVQKARWIPTKYSKRKSQQVSESEARVSLRLSFLTSMKLQIRSDLYGKMRTIAIRDK
ncbi:hypothetical protein CEXT_176451 [Caerostris extrusa]|uniref:Uncharacterized protein n=2 Tax=Caerostris extrusa TaxID=172846 RepID=A0AAV4QH00_CAEEX|nr:hypothetical protein CEXT_176451 [Caerostris extrusa]